MSVNHFTPTERRILNVLADGLPHRREELHACLPDELGAVANVYMHVTNLRRKLAKRGEAILCEFYLGSYYYRHVLLRAEARRALMGAHAQHV